MIEQDSHKIQQLLESMESFSIGGEMAPSAQTKYQEASKSQEVVDQEIKSEFLLPSNEMPWELLDLFQEVPNPDKMKFYDGLLHTPEPLSRTSYRFKRSGIKGSISGYKEELNQADIDNANSSNSLSVKRQFTSKAESLRGKTTFLPFKPGGLSLEKDTKEKDETALLHRDENGLFDIPFGLSRGLSIYDSLAESSDINNLGSVEENDEEPKATSQPLEAMMQTSLALDNNAISSSKTIDSELDGEMLGLLQGDYGFTKSAFAQPEREERRRDWAHVVDLDHKLENFHELVPNMAREWPFELDTFQQEAVYHLEQGDSVFVAAHTSAGKTVVAEYAIAMAHRNMTKAIYTSPIKALSNQKFRDFKQDFKEVDVGLITGDVQINAEANCLIMTTEILRSMLYRGADLIRDVEFVIFDEVHYVNDIDRGVVWEEVIIMLPDHVKFILLSATVPNTFEFANWVGRTKQKDIYVISTPKRPVPLEIFVWAKTDLYKVINAQRNFLESGFKQHKDVLQKPTKDIPESNGRGGRGGARGGRGGRGGAPAGRGGQQSGRGGLQVSQRGRGNFGGRPGGSFNRDGPNKNTWIQLVQYLKQHNLLPAVTFVFSQKRCEEYADTLKSIDFCNAKEKSEIHMFIDKSVSRLKKEDRELPQILKVREMLSRGIAVHHGGLLPIVKECIEILFSKTLIKVLFATETFAMGLNLPTRTVVFSSLRKHDGRGFRNLLPGEFTQMSGRAGRRGLDPTGTVIVMSYNEPLSPTDFKEVTLGASTKLQSQFRLTYNMILNLLRIEALRVEEMIKHSFSENSAQVLMPEHQKQVEMLTEELKSHHLDDCDTCGLEGLEEIHSSVVEYNETYTKLMIEVMKTPQLKGRMKIGRLIVFRDEDGVLRPGFIARSNLNEEQFIVLTFNLGEAYENKSRANPLPHIPLSQYVSKYLPKMEYHGGLKFVTAPFKSIGFVGKYILHANINELIQQSPDAIEEAIKQIKVLMNFQKKWEEISWDLSGTKLSVHELLTKKQDIVVKLYEYPTFSCASFAKHISQINSQFVIKSKIRTLQSLISDESLELLPDYEQRLEVLQDLGFVDHNLNVVLKGRVACEVNSGWELLITELVLDNFLADFEPEEIVALLSCFVYEGRNQEEEEIAITPRLEKGKVKIRELAENLLGVYQAHQVPLTSEEEEFLERKRFALVNVVYEWARGMSFNEIMKLSVEAEGTIVRVITRLDEICREVKSAALIVGDSVLHSKMSEAQEKIKRDIVFCASLYL